MKNLLLFLLIPFALSGCLFNPIVGYENESLSLDDISLVNLEGNGEYSGKIKKILGRYKDSSTGKTIKVKIDSPEYDYQTFSKLIPGAYAITAECFKFGSIGRVQTRTFAQPTAILTLKKGNTYHLRCKAQRNDKFSLENWLSYETVGINNLVRVQKQLHSKLGFPLSQSMFSFSVSSWLNNLEYNYYSFTEAYLGKVNFSNLLDEIKTKNIKGFIGIDEEKNIISFDKSVISDAKKIHEILDKFVNKYSQIASKQVGQRN